MNIVSDIINYVRRIIKSPLDTDITDSLIIDYINRFWIMDVDARMQLFDLKTLYRFQTTPGITMYNMPLYSIQTENDDQAINPYPVYQGFLGPCTVNGIPVGFYTQKQQFWSMYPNYSQVLPNSAVGDGTAGPYTINVPFFPCIPGHIDMAGIIALGNPVQDPPFGSTFNTGVPVTSVYSSVYFTSLDANGNTVQVADSGQFLSGSGDGDLYGLLMQPGSAPFGNQALIGGYSTTSNTINYATGVATVTFPTPIPSGQAINSQCYFYNPGLPRGILFYNNTITLLPTSDISYLVEMEAYLTPAAFLNSSAAVQFAYMAEYIARGAARKILSDTGDIEQFMFYEPLFKEQELLVWKRSQRQFTATRTPTIFANQTSQNIGEISNYGAGIY